MCYSGVVAGITRNEAKNLFSRQLHQRERVCDCHLSGRRVRGGAAPVCGDGVDSLQHDGVLLVQRVSVDAGDPTGLGGREVTVAMLRG